MSHSSFQSGLPISPGKAVADDLIISLGAKKTPPPYVTHVSDAGPLPPKLVEVKTLIEQNTGTPVWDILLGAIRGSMVFRPQFGFASGQWSADRDKAFRNIANGSWAASRQVILLRHVHQHHRDGQSDRDQRTRPVPRSRRAE